MKHLETRFLWTQERFARGRIKRDTVASKDNCSDLLTETLSKNDIRRHMQEFRKGRAFAAKRVVNVEDRLRS